MTLVELQLQVDNRPLPDDVRSFLAEADRRIDDYQQTNLLPGFVPSNFERVYAVLRSLAQTHLVTGRRFCEWGSGFGVVAGLASMVGFDACGIEIDHELQRRAQKLADDFSLPIEFIQGSFIPAGAELCLDSAYLDSGDGITWLVTDTNDELDDYDPDEFDLIFAYPWPDEVRAIEDLFDQFAAVGAVLIIYHANAEICLRRKRR